MKRGETGAGVRVPTEAQVGAGLLHAVTAGVLVLDVFSGAVREANARALTLLGLGPGELPEFSGLAAMFRPG
jgi:hypothetical protein